jgi:hypothetical protein
MKKLVLILFVSTLIMCTSCTQKQRQDLSHWKSDLIGLKRSITLYGENGKPIKTWEGRYKVETSGCTARFLHEGKAIIISGTFVIEEK